MKIFREHVLDRGSEIILKIGRTLLDAGLT